MDVHQDIAAWVRRMGYDGEIPESMISVCNNSTSFIWEELMQNLKPKQEVENIRKNVVLNRLKTKRLERQDEFAFQLNTIEVFKHKRACQQKLKLLKEEVQEKRYKVSKLSQNCKIQGAIVEQIKKKIKSNEERHYLLELKENDLQQKCLNAEQILKDIKCVTPVEMDENVATQDKIMETLEKCAEKLQESSEKTLSLKIPQKSFVQIATSVKKKPLNVTTLASYLNKTEKESFQQISSTKKCQDNEKENRPSNEQVHNVKKAFFLQPPDIRIEAVDGSIKTLSYDKVVRCVENTVETHLEISEHLEIRETKQPKKRESLGILPESCLSEFDEDEFLQPISLQKLETFNESDECSIINYQTIRTDSDSDSISINIKAPLKKQISKEDNVKDAIYDNPDINRNLVTVMRSYNMQMVYAALQIMFKNVGVELTNLISTWGGIEERRAKISEEDITRLLFVHVQTELNILNQKRVIKDLLAKIGNVKMHILDHARSKNEKELQEVLNDKIQQVALDASIASMKKEIENSMPNEDNKERQLITLKIAKVKDEIANKMSRIQSYIKETYNIQKLLIATRENALGPVWNLRLYKNDESWSNPLAEGLWTQEMKAFEKFPLEYQRKCTFTDSKTFYRDLCVDSYSLDTKITSEEMQMINEILESPTSPPETVLINLIKSKMKLVALRTMRNSRRGNQENASDKKYSLEELLHHESYLNFAIEKLQSLMYSQTAGKTLAIGDVIKKTMEIWSEMPMKEFISSSRLYEGESYQFYDSKLRALCG